MVAAGRCFRRESGEKLYPHFCFRFVANRRSWIAISCTACIAYTQKTLKCYQFTELARSIHSSGSRRQQQWSLSCLRNRDQKHNRTPVGLMALVLLIVDTTSFSSSYSADRLESHSFTRSTRTVSVCWRPKRVNKIRWGCGHVVASTSSL